MLVNLHLPRLAGACGKFFQLGAFCLLCLEMNLVSAHADEDSTVVASNYPAIFLVTAPHPDVTNGLGYWMWDKVTLNKQTVRFWHRFDVPKTNLVTGAELRIAADNAFRVWLDGQELGSGSDWRTLSIYHLEGTLKPGGHTLAVEGFNDNDQAGIIFGLRLEMANGEELQIRSDQTWRVVPNWDRGWETALRPAENWPYASLASNFGRIPWWTVPASVLHVRGGLPKPIPVWQSRGFQAALFVVFVIICIYLVIQLVSQSKAHHLVQAERDRIARDIHDDLGSELTKLLLRGEVAQITSGADSPLSQMCAGTRNILATIDEVIWTVNSQNDNLEDFSIYVCKYAQYFLESTAIRFRFDVAADLPARTLSQLVRRDLFLAVKEALNNAAKHSKATELTVRIELTGFRLNVVVADNGRGFDPVRTGHEGKGLSNMKQRMAEIGGNCEIANRPGEGCQVSFQVPLKRRSFFRKRFQASSRNDSVARTSLDDKFDPVSTGKANDA